MIYELAFLSLGPTRQYVFCSPKQPKSMLPSPQISLISDAHSPHLEPQAVRYWNIAIFLPPTATERLEVRGEQVLGYQQDNYPMNTKAGPMPKTLTLPLF